MKGISLHSARLAIFLSLAVATSLGCWYLRVRVPENQWRRPHEAGRDSLSRGLYHEAERQFATAAAFAYELGKDDPRLALSLAHQADALIAQDRFDEAIPLFERALEIDQKLLGVDHPDLVPVLERYAVPLRKTGRIAQAEAVEARARGSRTAARPGSPPGSPGRAGR